MKAECATMILVDPKRLPVAASQDPANTAEAISFSSQ